MTVTFKLKPNPTFKTAISITAPGGDTVDLMMICKHKGREALQDFLERTKKVEGYDAKPLLEIFEGWEDCDTPFSLQALGDLTQNYHQAAFELINGYCLGLAGARRGN